MAQVYDWSSITLDALQRLWQGFIGFLPELIGALVVLIVGWFVSVWIGRLVTEILKRLKLDRLFERTRWEKAFEKAELKMSVSDFIGDIVKWILVIVFLLAAVEILGLGQFAGFLKAIVAWLPNLVVAVAIFVVAVIVADFSERIFKAIVGKMEVGYTKFLGSIIRWSIWIFAILAILSQLGVASEIVQILVGGFVALIVISSGLAFGLGGKDLAREVLEGLKGKLRE